MLFDAEVAFSRSLGWISQEEMKVLSRLRVGVVGLGGVGGHYCEILTRLGVGHFVIADFDTFSIENSNRQNSCRVGNYGLEKSKVIGELIKDINPSATVEIWPNGIEKTNVDLFCEKIDIYLDGLDFFETDLRILIFRRMREINKTCITAAPIGTGAASIVFTKDSMSFDDYFGLHTTDKTEERAILFLLGLTPGLLHRKYVLDETRIDFKLKKAPSLPMGVYSAASAAATLLMKIVFSRGPVAVAPWSCHYDPYLSKLKQTYVPWGFRNPLQRLKFVWARLLTKRKSR